MVDFLDLMILELSQECFEGVFVFGDEETSSRLSIDTMDKRWLEGETGVFASIVVLHQLDQRDFFRLVISWVDIEMSGFVYT